MYIYDLRPQRLPQRRWTTIVDYAVYDARNKLITCPRLKDLRHKGYSTVFDSRLGRDALEGLNRMKGH